MSDSYVRQTRSSEDIRREFSDWLTWKNTWPDSAPWRRDWEEARRIADALRLWLVGYQHIGQTVLQVKDSMPTDFQNQFLRTEEEIEEAVEKLKEIMDRNPHE